MSGIRLFLITIGIFCAVSLFIYATFFFEEYYRLHAGSQSWFNTTIVGPVARLNDPIERIILGGNINPYDNGISSPVLYRERKGFLTLLDWKCDVEECLTQKLGGELYGTAALIGYYTEVERIVADEKKTICDGFVITDGSEALKKYYDELLEKKSVLVSRNSKGETIINLDLSESALKEREYIKDTNTDSLVEIMLIKGGKENFGNAGCFSDLGIVKVDEQKFYPVSFCDNQYLTQGFNVNGVDVIKRIAQIASANIDDGICNEVQSRQTGKYLDSHVSEPENHPDYKLGDFRLHINSSFKISGNNIFKVDELGNELEFYGNLK